MILVVPQLYCLYDLIAILHSPVLDHVGGHAVVQQNGYLQMSSEWPDRDLEKIHTLTSHLESTQDIHWWLTSGQQARTERSLSVAGGILLQWTMKWLDRIQLLSSLPLAVATTCGDRSYSNHSQWQVLNGWRHQRPPRTWWQLDCVCFPSGCCSSF